MQTSRHWLSLPSQSQYTCLACRYSTYVSSKQPLQHQRNATNPRLYSGQVNVDPVTGNTTLRAESGSNAFQRSNRRHILSSVKRVQAKQHVPSRAGKARRGTKDEEDGASHRRDYINDARRNDSSHETVNTFLQHAAHWRKSTVSLKHTRRVHTTSSRRAELESRELPSDGSMPAPLTHVDSPSGGIRDRLRQWLIEHKDDVPRPEAVFKADTESSAYPPNTSRLGAAGDGVEVATHEPDDTSDTAISSDDLDELSHNIAYDTGAHFLRKGDLVFLTTPGRGKGILAIYIRGRTALQFYSMDGSWKHLFRDHVRFRSAGFAPTELVDDLLPYLPSEDDITSREFLQEAMTKDTSVPREIGAPLINMMNDFEAESLRIYRNNADMLDNAHEMLAHPTDLRYGTLSHVALRLLQLEPSDLTPAALYTVDLAMLRAGHAFHMDGRHYVHTGFLQVRSKEQLKSFKEIIDWIREWQDTNLNKDSPSRGHRIISSFIVVIKRMILKSRATREPSSSGRLGPSKVVRKLSPEQDSVEIVLGEQFSKEHQNIMSFFEALACSHSMKVSFKPSSLTSTILKATGLYTDYEIDIKTCFLFLQEIGLLLPYENPLHYNIDLMLPSSGQSKPLVKLATSIMAQAKKGFRLEDSMAELRHDWGELPVYCIDSASTVEVDDGISIEPGETMSDHWLHIHIANPSAFLKPTDDISRMARHMGESIYCPDRSHMMLPGSVSNEYWSLAPGRPTLTFSARIDEDGSLLETKVRPGIIHNVKRITYEQVDEALNNTSFRANELVLRVGGDPPVHQQSSLPRYEMNQTDIATLQLLSEIGYLRLSKRRRTGLTWRSAQMEVNVWTSWNQSGLPYIPQHFTGSRIVHGDPIIEMRTFPYTNPFVPDSGKSSKTLVEEAMLLAVECGASWCVERGIPQLFRGKSVLADTSKEMVGVDEFWRTKCAPAMAKNNGELPGHIGLQLIVQYGSTAVSAEPLPHEILGMPFYCKLTSPLRRYGDMVAHWQIEAALKEEARTGKSLATPDARTKQHEFLPFSKTALESMMLGYKARENLISQTKTKSIRLWATQLLNRAVNYNEIALPFDTYTVEISSDPGGSAARWVSGVMVELSLHTRMLLPKLGGIDDTVQWGDRWECIIESVDCYRILTTMMPIKLLHRPDL